MRYVASIGDRRVVVEVEENGRLRRITLDDTTLDVDWQPVGEAGATAGHYSLLIGNRSYEVFVRAVPDAAGAATVQVFEVQIQGRPYVVRLEDERAHALAGLAGAVHERGEAAITAPMPGLVTKIMASIGDHVEPGQTIVVLEAMKMENDLATPRSGVVRAIHVTQGQAVNQGEVLAVVGEAEGAGAATSTEEDEE